MRCGLGSIPDRIRAVTALAGGALALVAAPAVAQSLSAEQSGLFPRQLARPDDYQLNYQYATAASQGRDYEAAIVALERLLYFNPNLSRAKYELGVLYFRMGSFAMAAHYFDAALATPGLEEQIRRRVEVMLPQARKELSPSRFYGVIQAGVGYDSNFTQSRGVAPIRSFGAWAINPMAVPKVGGANATVLGDVLHVYDFQDGRGDLWETRVAGVTTLQPAYAAYSAGYVEASTGPRIALAPGTLPGLSVRPYVVGDHSSISGAGFAQSGGAGVSAHVPLGGAFSLDPGVEYRRIDVSATNLPFASQYVFNTGSLLSTTLAAQWRPLDWLLFDGRGVYRRNATAAPWTSSREFGLQGSAKIDFDPPIDTIGWRWSVTPFVRYASYAFDAADPSVDPWVTRRDRQWRAGAQFDMPVTPDWGVSASVQYSRTSSNIANYNASSWSFLVGPTYRLTSLYDRRSSAATQRAPSAIDWSGFYAGLNAGADFGARREVVAAMTPFYAIPVLSGIGATSAALASSRAAPGGAGAAVGMQAGYDWLVSGAALVGLEASADFYVRRRGAQTIAAGTTLIPATADFSTTTLTQSNDWLGTLRARAGYLIMPQLLAFGSAGAAFGGVRSGVAIAQAVNFGVGIPMAYWASGSKAGVRLGYVVGGGLEWMFRPGWSLRADYSYRDLGGVGYPIAPLASNYCGTTCYASVGRASTHYAASEVRAAVNYHFVLADAPAVTK